MIKATDLRIGNWIYNINYIKNAKITQLWADVEFTELEPIPLTPEILEKAGFKFITNSWYEKGEINVNLKDYRICIDQIKGQVFMNSNIKYLHQLQNLYFVLTGEELEITF